MSALAIRPCLISQERERFAVRIGLREPVCGEPPFDAGPAQLRLWSWPWSDWPTFNRAVFDQDLQRVLRFYRARGFYDAKIARVRFHPERVGTAGTAARCGADAPGCRVDVRIVIDEGQPTRVSEIALRGAERLPEALQASLREQIELVPGEPVDEALHDRSKTQLVRRLRQAGFAAARLEARLEVDPRAHQARALYLIEPGPLYRFGRVEVSGNGALPRDVIENAAGLRDQRFDPAALREAEAEVFALGAFSAVEAREQLVPERRRADVILKVTPLPPDSLRVGFGISSGATRRSDTEEVQSVPQFDLHLFARYQRRQLLGSLGQVTVEDRPRWIFNAPFPDFSDPRFGNVLSVGLNQPGWLEARTTALARASVDYGPDAYLGFVRTDLSLRVGASRAFFARRLDATLSAEQDVFAVGADPNDVRERGLLPVSYRYAFLEQELVLDVRDSPVRTRSGAYFALLASGSLRSALSDWTTVRVSPEVRAYLPLPFDMVLGQRFALASLGVSDASASLDAVSRELGPTNYRLRGGGANSNRGFIAGTLGAGLAGGTRRWEASLELRIPIGGALVLAGFADLGDVNRAARYRFSHWNTTLGYGLRYYTLIGAIRLDVGHRIPAWQRPRGRAPSLANDAGEATGTLPFSDAPGAIHLTIGEAF